MIKLDPKNDPFKQHSLAAGVLYKSVDLLAVFVAAIVPGLLLINDFPWQGHSYQIAILLALLLTLIIFERFGLYEAWRGRSVSDQAGELAAAWVTLFIILIVGAYLLKVSSHFSRIWAGSWFVFGFICLFSARSLTMLVLRSLRRRGLNHKKVAIVGAGPWAREVARRIKAAEWMGLDVDCFVHPEDAIADEYLDGIPVQGHYRELPRIIDENAIDEVWICLPASGRDTHGIDHIEQVLHILRHSTLNKRMIPDLADLRLLRHPIVEVLGLPTISLNSSPFHGLNGLIKNIEDIVLASMLIVLLSPLLVTITALVKLTSPGPVLFRQARHGWDGRPFDVYKFRSMVVHSEKNAEITQATKGDPRITRFGRFLRRTSLDELPQLVNVLRGEMSIVGPRPHAIPHGEHFKDRVDSYMQRHKVKPGITGWAQVNGWRGPTDTVQKMARRVELDIYYIENWSLWFDIKILFKTVFSRQSHANAH